MVWSHWRKAIWRGAPPVLLMWAGFAWTQTPVPNAPGAERIMIVHENNKATRCRVVESWQLPDKRIAHLLQSTETGEMITIVDEQAPIGDPGDVKNARSMAKRIFAWGSNRKTPPEGSPVPPHLRMDSGIVLKNESAPPSDAVHQAGAAVINQVVDDKAIGGGSQPNGTIRLTQKEPLKSDPQVVEFTPPVINVGDPAPLPNGGPTPQTPPAIPQVQTLKPNPKIEGCEPATNPRLVAQPISEPCPPIIVHEMPGTIIETGKKSWRPGDKLQTWLLNRSRPTEIVTMETVVPVQHADMNGKAPFSTAMPTATLPSAVTETKKPAAEPLAIGTKPGGDKLPTPEKHDMWGPAPIAKKAEPKVDPILAPDRITPKDDQAKLKQTAPVARPNGQWPLNSQSALAAKSGMQGPVTYVPYPIVTVPQPHHPPMPPDPKLPEAPQLNAFVNAFTPPPMPAGQSNPNTMPQGNPMMAQQQMMQQQMMQQQAMQQQMMQRQMLAQGGGPNSMMAPYRQPVVSQGPMSNGGRQYQGPMPPNLIAGNAPMQAGFMQAPYAPMMPPQHSMLPPPQQPTLPPQQPMLQQVGHQMPTPSQQSPAAQQIDQLIKAMCEAPFPSQREWAAQQLVAFDWRAHPQVIQALLQSAAKDPAVSVRAGCIYCLGRTQASIEPVLGALNAMRNDPEARVRQEVEQALTRLSQTPVAAR